MTQSSLRSPCEPLPNGFDSGWVFVDNSDPNAQPPEWHLYIEDDTKRELFGVKDYTISPLTVNFAK